jgi:hypothetical protein
MEETRNAYKILTRKPEEMNLLEDQSTHGKIILKWILEMQNVKVWTGLN